MPRKLIAATTIRKTIARQHDRDVDEHLQVVAAEAARQRARRGDAAGHDREGDHEGDERLPEGLVDVQRRAGGARVLGHELGVGEGGEDRQDEREREGGPDRAAGLGPDLADERVDAGAEHVADDEDQQRLAPDDALEVLLGRGFGDAVAAMAPGVPSRARR